MANSKKITKKKIDAMLDLSKLTPELVQMILGKQIIPQTKTKVKESK